MAELVAELIGEVRPSPLSGARRIPVSAASKKIK
jgi:hypothetical protein